MTINCESGFPRLNKLLLEIYTFMYICIIVALMHTHNFTKKYLLSLLG